MQTLSDVAQDLIAAARAERGISSEQFAEGRERLRAYLSVGAGSASLLATRSALTFPGKALVLQFAVLGMLAALGTGVTLGMRAKPTAPPPNVTAMTTANANRPESSASQVQVPMQVGSAATGAPEPQVAPSVPHVAAVRAARSTEMGVADDAKLLRDVRTALAEGRDTEAFNLLERRRKDQRAGVLAPEREAARLVVLCKMGRSGEAKAAVSKFLQRYPGSPLAVRVRQEWPAPERP